MADLRNLIGLALQGQQRTPPQYAPSMRVGSSGVNISISPHWVPDRPLTQKDAEQMIPNRKLMLQEITEIKNKFKPEYFGHSRPAMAFGAGPPSTSDYPYTLGGMTQAIRELPVVGGPASSALGAVTGLKPENAEDMMFFTKKREAPQQRLAAELNEGRPTDPDFERASGLIMDVQWRPDQAKEQIDKAYSSALVSAANIAIAAARSNAKAPGEIVGALGGPQVMKDVFLEGARKSGNPNAYAVELHNLGFLSREQAASLIRAASGGPKQPQGQFPGTAPAAQPQPKGPKRITF